MSEQGLYKIGTAARLSGLSVATLRNWEHRYGLVVPYRSDGGQRLYSREQIEQLRLLRRWIDEWLSAGEAHRRLRDLEARHAEGGEPSWV